MKYTGMEFLWLFLVYSFLGWVLETAVGTIKRKRFTNRGFTTGPFCGVYGTAAVLMAAVLQELRENPVFLFLGCAAVATAVEWITGKTLERLNRKKWWDYSEKRWNFDGYICLSYSVLWGILGFVAVRWGDDFFIWLYHALPGFAAKTVTFAAAAVVFCDTAASLATVRYVRQRSLRVLKTAGESTPVRKFQYRTAVLTRRLGKAIEAGVERRMEKAYPLIFEAAEQITKRKVFAEGCGFYKLFWLFLIGAVLGDLVETVFCRLTAGVWMSRSSLVWGPFSIVWGLAIAAATALLYKDREKPDRHLFFIGTVLGGAYEYVCSVFTELVFGTVFWDYSEIPFNLGGRINLLYCFFWGIAAVIWIKGLYPFFSGWIEKIPVLWGYILTWVLVVFMASNIVVSSMALIRYDRRSEGMQADNVIEKLLDEHFDDERMERIYPNALAR
ncbi:putative ABC transporter permease [Clostridium sp. M62/1]|uniref:putative ABC transporter permease n=2 Tax=Clostridium sp. M62/1 TaxID=411486 RepID=UPI0001C34D99|nr:putative ABC transporter permease [Clostridium sp. M62/1]UEB78436.1 putative ABC transporter permease [Clostridium sp. M62/1]